MKTHTHLILGDDEYARREEVEAILSRIFARLEERTPDSIRRVNAPEITEELLLSMKSLSFFVTKQVFIVSQIEKCKKKQLELLSAYLDRPVDFTYLILEGESFSGRESEVKTIKERATLHTLKKEYDSALRGIIFQKVKQCGCRIVPDAVETLLARSGGSASFLSASLDKIFLAVKTGDEITESLVNDLMEDHEVFDVYALTNAISERNVDQSLNILNYLLTDGSKEIELIGMIAWQFRRFYEAKVMMDQGVAPAQIAQKLRVYGKYLNQFIQHVRSFSEKEIRIIIRTLLEIDSKAKMSASDTRKEIEMLLVRLCCKKLI